MRWDWTVGRRSLAAVVTAAAGAAVTRAQATEAVQASSVEALRVLSGGALEPAVAAALVLWRANGGSAVVVEFATAPRIAERLTGGERPGLVLAPPTTLEALDGPDGPPSPLGSVAVGVAVREGTPLPDLSSDEALRAELLAADAVVFNRASTGLYVERVLQRLGWAEALAAKVVRFPDGDAVLRHIAEGRGREIAFAASTEILLFRDRGVRLVGPPPAPFGNRTAYAAALPTGAGVEAQRFRAFLTSPPVRAAMVAAGVE